jgi:hypothetical protein
MFRLALPVLLSVAAIAQTTPPPAEKPPAEVEQAVRARVNEFYNLLLHKEYRKAEVLIAEDTKDYYYNGSKLDISKFEVQGIEYSENFTRAKAWTLCYQHVIVLGFPPGDVILKMPTAWRLENGTWLMYVDLSKQFGPTGTPIKSLAPGATPSLLPLDIPTTPGFALGKVHADKDSVEMAVGATQKVTITNDAPGVMKLELGYPVNGLDAKLDRTELGGGQKAILTFTGNKGLSPGIYSLRIMPTQEILSIQVKVK